MLIYAHGNAGNRASEHRVRLYEQLLRDRSAYRVDTVVAFDYSGFAGVNSFYFICRSMPTANAEGYDGIWGVASERSR